MPNPMLAKLGGKESSLFLHICEVPWELGENNRQMIVLP